MDLQRYTQKAQDAVLGATRLAEESQHQEVGIDHLVVSLAEQPDGVVPRLLRLRGVDPTALITAGRQAIAARPKVFGDVKVYLSAKLSKAADTAEKEAERLKDDFVSTEHLFLGAIDQAEGQVATFLRTAGLTRDAVYQALAQLRGNQRVTDQNPESKYEALLKYARDLTEAAEHLLPAGEPNERFFRLILAVRNYLAASGSAGVWPAVTYFALWSAKLGGFLGPMELDEEETAIGEEMLRVKLADVTPRVWTRGTAAGLRQQLIRTIEEHVERRITTLQYL